MKKCSFLLMVVVVSCGSSNDKPCDSGDSKPCACTCDDQCIQLCNKSGTGWGECFCPEEGLHVLFNLQSVDFTIDASRVRTALQRYLDDHQISLDISSLDELPAEVDGIPLEVFEAFEVEVQPTIFDLSGPDFFGPYLEAGNWKCPGCTTIQREWVKGSQISIPQRSS